MFKTQWELTDAGWHIADVGWHSEDLLTPADTSLTRRWLTDTGWHVTDTVRTYRRHLTRPAVQTGASHAEVRLFAFASDVRVRAVAHVGVVPAPGAAAAMLTGVAGAGDLLGAEGPDEPRCTHAQRLPVGPVDQTALRAVRAVVVVAGVFGERRQRHLVAVPAGQPAVTAARVAIGGRLARPAVSARLTETGVDGRPAQRARVLEHAYAPRPVVPVGDAEPVGGAEPRPAGGGVDQLAPHPGVARGAHAAGEVEGGEAGGAVQAVGRAVVRAGLYAQAAVGAAVAVGTGAFTSQFAQRGTHPVVLTGFPLARVADLPALPPRVAGGAAAPVPQPVGRDGARGVVSTRVARALVAEAVAEGAYASRGTAAVVGGGGVEAGGGGRAGVTGAGVEGDLAAVACVAVRAGTGVPGGSEGAADAPVDAGAAEAALVPARLAPRPAVRGRTAAVKPERYVRVARPPIDAGLVGDAGV